ncbi:MAG: TonB-dependent receptor [Chromatiales bacterium]|nr:TonB-dependent receptor [Chromatiales bacterium]
MSSSRTLVATRAGLTAASLAMTVLAAQPAVAAEEVTEIIVTVRQRAESIQDVPGSVTAFSAAQIEAAGIQRADDFIAMTPGVSIVNSAEVADTQVNIRGINGARDAETNYALIIDGVLMTNPAALNREYTNLQQIEVLKGPQGALYGRNAAAGAIIITTEKPGDEWAGNFKATMAEDDTYTVAGLYGGPVTDTLGISVSGDFRDTDGYYNNAYYASIGGSTDVVDNFQSWDLAVRAVWQPTDALSVDGKVRVGNVEAGSITFNSLFHIPSLVPVLEGFFGFPAEVAAFANENVNGHDFQFDNNIVPFNNQDAVEASVKVDYDLGWADVTAWGLYSNIENDLGADGTSGAFGFFWQDQQCRDTTAALFNGGNSYPLIPPQAIGPTPEFSLFGAYTPTACDGTQYQVRNQEDYSFEVRLASKGDQRLRWLGGLYYLNIEREVGVNTGIDRGFGIIPTLFTTDARNPTEQLVHDEFNTDVYAVFGQLAYDVTDTIEASLALRYDREERDVDNLVPLTATTQYINTCDPNDPIPGLDPINPGLCATGGIPSKSETYDQLQPKFSITWDATDSLTAFATAGVGFKSGGFNNQGAAATIDLFINTPLIIGTGTADDRASWDGPFGGIDSGYGRDVTGNGIGDGFDPVGIQDSYKEETSWAYEAGLKSQLLDDRLRVELAVYHVDVDDMQFFEFIVGGFGLLRVVSNIDEVDIDGVELAVNFAATDWLSLYAGANFNDTEIKKNTARPDSVGNESPYTPDYTWSAGAQVQFPMSADYDFVGSVDISGVGETWFHVIQNDERPTIFSLNIPGLGPSNLKLTKRDAYSLVNLRAGIAGDRWSVVGFVKNALGENYLEEVIPAPEFGGTFDHPGTERRLGVEATLKF